MGQAGMLAMMLLVPGCSEHDRPPVQNKEEPLRRAAFKSLAARDFLMSCPSAADRGETRSQVRRFDELKQLAARKQAAHPLWLGENDWAAISRNAHRQRCGTGDEAYREALSAFAFTLDTLAERIAQYR